MINIIEQGDTKDYGVLSLVCDTATDLEDLETQYENAKSGSTCLVISTAEVYMKNSLNNWIKL